MRRTVLIIGLVAALAAGACTGGGTPRKAARASTIPQPDAGNLPTADASRRVDLAAPRFSHPTRVTNPLFPVSSQKSVLMLGHVEGKPFRTEVTLLPETRVIQWLGQKVETLVSQYNAFLDGRIEEIAYDYYAQDDAGAVWYFGEDVYDFAGGVIISTEGTWLAGRDGPAAMIMPPNPKVGDAFRTENVPGFVFEEVTVKQTDKTLDGPLGSIRGGIQVSELHMDATSEDKQFAPGYGEFYTAGGGDLEALALAVPTDAGSGPVSADAQSITSGALTIFDAAGSKDWRKASSTFATVAAAWARSKAAAPRLVAPVMTTEVEALSTGVKAKDVARARQGAIDVARLGFDLQLRFRPVAEVDRARFDLWAAQMLIDSAAKDWGSVNGDFFAMDYVRDRIHRSLDPATYDRLNLVLQDLLSAITDKDFGAIGKGAAKVRSVLA